MSTATSRKPPGTGIGRLADSANSSSPASPRTPRSATPTSSGTGTLSSASSHARTRSTRGGTPGSARASVQRGSSSLASTEADEAARAENIALIDDLKARLEKADGASEQYRKQAEVLQSKLDEALKEQAKMEERVHESEEQIEALSNEKREMARQMREMENIYEAEKSSILKEKEEMSNREEEMQAVINRMKESLNQRNADDEYRPTRQSSNSSPNIDNGSFAPPSSIDRSDSRNNSKFLLQKDKLIESLRLELAEAQIKLVESENQGGGRLHDVERLLMETRMANARLMEDNESYQLLLQEKTLHGDFGKGDFSYMGASTSNQDALNALEGRPASRGEEKPAGASLADELGDIGDDSTASHADDSDQQRRLEGEVRAMRDQNKALTLYINKIIERLLSHQDFEHILDQSADFKPSANTNKDLPPPPSDKEKQAAASASALLARNRNSNPPTGRPKPRPISFMPSAGPTAHNNPETAPSIPIGLGRSASSRRGRPMSEQFVGAAGIVNAMYKGNEGPISPTLSNPRNSFQGIGGPTTPRHASSSSGAPTAGNFPGMRSESSSVSGDSAEDRASTSASSPPRTLGSGHSHSMSHEKGAKFEGNKPRPLRLVQENTEPPKDKRASWFGWASSALAKKDDAAPGEAIKE